ncbi:hypothetical protein TCAL_00256 [Tigriopus californicus]|uniref:RanBD1 domain-containing protein n=1 Tax=Tigriopus californicus TaxID=6832 RepID=A0A553P381_TIGCA|nr:hypothetical protein TCAL_00256 [Tigriopus californicus]|eukprot:TCALIF_00256-PA protein Name:"Similar to RANGAP1 Ran GTPase-activating protein 1 (Homo sapiens)" AED:0.06 eAED:0.12 QI:120/0.5/0.4/1/1/0.8/5/0/1869
MALLRSKKDVDAYVEQLTSKIHSENERNLKAFSLAKLYYNVGDFESAKAYLSKYIALRPNSALAFSLHGQSLEQLRQPGPALKSYQTAFELDPSQKELLLKIVELCSILGPQIDRGKAKYWLDQSQKHFPHHPKNKKLQSALNQNGTENEETNGNNITNGLNNSSQDSPPDRENLDGSLWSTSLLFGSRRNPMLSRVDTPERSSTPLSASLDTPKRGGGQSTLPRPSPERLEAQVRSLEVTQNKMVDLLLDQNKVVVEELRLHRTNVVEEMKTHRQNVSDLKMEMKQGLHDLKLEVAKLGQTLKEPKDDLSSLRELREIRELLASLPRQIANAIPPPPPPPPTATPVPQSVAPLPSASSPSPSLSGQARSLQLQDLQEALAQQTALLQMSSLGFAANMFARPPGPHHPHPGAGVVPAPHLNHSVPPPSGPHIPPVPTFRHGAEWIPPVGLSPPNIVPEHKSPAHDYQITLPRSNVQTTDPFEGQEGPALPITTNALLSNIPAPVFSSLSKTPPKATSTTTTNTNTSQHSATSVTNSSSKGFGEQFKPKVGSWECAGCLMRNEGDTMQCPACQTAQPGYENEVKKKEETAKPQVTFGAQGGFKFGFPGATTAPASNTGGGFTFGGGPAPSAPTSKPEVAPTTSSTIGSSGHLSFENQSLKLNTEADAKAVAEKIKSTKKMVELTFAGNTIGIDAAKAIGQALEVHPEFEKAHWKDMFTGRMKTEIPPALQHLSRGIMKANAKLVELDLSDNAFGPIGMEGIKDLLKSPSCFTLKELKLNNTGCGVTGGKALAKTLLECYHSSKKQGTPLGLKVFILGRSRQENDGAKALAEVFKLMGTLEEVVMPQNGIYHEGIAALTDAFANNPNLRILNLNDNTFTVKGAQQLANVLPKLQKLQVLNLGDCLLKTEGAILVAKALETGHMDLEELHLDSNEIRVDGGVRILESMLDKPKLRQLTLDANQFGEAGCQRLMSMLKAKGKENIVGEEIEEDEEPDSDEDNEEDGDEDEDDDDDDDYEDDEEYEGQDGEEDDYYEGEEQSQASPPKPAASIFGGPTTTFGTSSPSVGSIFGTPKADDKPSIFGGSPNPCLGGFFSTSTATPTTTTSSIFSTFSFGQPPATGTGTANTSTLAGAFGSIAASTAGFSFSTPGSQPSGSALGLGGSGVSALSPKKDDHDEVAHEDPDHDPHFEPIIPLPALVKVTTGEEDEETVFLHRSKVFRYDPDTKQWKERGIGDIKILRHTVKNSYRVLLRREQIHKVACNHLITKDMELKPMAGSQNAVCWFAMDYAEEEAKLEHLAARFKLPETKDEFKTTFEACQKALEDPSFAPKAIENNGIDNSKVENLSASKPDVVSPQKAVEEKVAAETKVATTPLFGSGPTTTPSPGLFGNTNSSSASPSIFGGGSASANTSIFGGSANKTASPSLFGGSAVENVASPSIFGSGGGVSSEASKSIFGESKAAPTSSIFGGIASNASTTGGFSFGKPSTDSTPETGSKGIDLSANKSLPSFADMTKSGNDQGGFSFAKNGENFKFAGQGASIFGKSPASKANDSGNAGDGDAGEDEHDPHFEPIIPLPELIKVTTGEEDEEVLFKHRAKVFRFDPETKQWKERGVGDMKILKHPQRNTFRILLRREQIHKVACNHLITKDMDLKAMFGSETAVCWFAMDYAEDEAKMEHLAVRFKEVATKNDFEAKFKQCQKDLDNHPSSPPKKKDEETRAHSLDTLLSNHSQTNPMFTAILLLLVTHVTDLYKAMVYDDDVYGARIIAYPVSSTSEGDEDAVCNHLIAMQTTLDTLDAVSLTWSALDFSRDPPAYRTFQVTFQNDEESQIFKDCFNEGKELAEQSEILEMPNELENPQDYYYGEGGDYEDNNA